MAPGPLLLLQPHCSSNFQPNGMGENGKVKGGKVVAPCYSRLPYNLYCVDGDVKHQSKAPCYSDSPHCSRKSQPKLDGAG